MGVSCELMARTFGEALEAAMAAAKMQPVELSKAAGIPLSQLSGYVNHRFPPGEEVCGRLATGLKIDVARLLNGVMTKWGLVLCAEGEGMNAQKPPGSFAAGPRRQRGK